MVIYEWKDVKYLGKVTSETDDSLPVSDARVAASQPTHGLLISAENLCLHNRRREIWLVLL